MRVLICSLAVITALLSCKSNNTHTSNQVSLNHTYYQTFGKGTPVLIINGGPGMNSDGFVTIAQKIAEMGCQAIIYDQRGTGKSVLDTLSPESVTIDLMVQDIETLRNQLNIKKWVVMGHSFGGLLATAYTSKHPNQVEKLIYSSSGGVNLKFMSYVQDRIAANLTAQERDSLEFYYSKMRNGDNSATTKRKRADFLARAYVYNKSYAPIIAERLTQVNFQLNGLVFQDLQKINFGFTASDFAHFQQPVLVLQGKNDVISIETAREITQTFSSAQLVLLDNCGHYGWLDQEKVYLESIRQFLKTNQ